MSHRASDVDTIVVHPSGYEAVASGRCEARIIKTRCAEHVTGKYLRCFMQDSQASTKWLSRTWFDHILSAAVLGADMEQPHHGQLSVGSLFEYNEALGVEASDVN
jgi:transposase-like protein